jgi:hypothetical protein
LELTDPELAEQLELCEALANELDAWKEKLKEMNRVSNELLDIHRRDDGHNLSHLSSKLNTQWTKFNDQLRIRRAVLEAAQRSRHDFQTAIGHFQQWLNRMILELQKLEKETENAQRLKDTGRRREWLAQEKVCGIVNGMSNESFFTYGKIKKSLFRSANLISEKIAPNKTPGSYKF